jgi:excisionase family DNA binding protein
MSEQTVEVQRAFWNKETMPATTLTTREAAKRAGVSQRVIQRWAQAGLITAARDRQHYRIDTQSLEAHLQKRPVAGQPLAPQAAAPQVTLLREQVNTLKAELAAAHAREKTFLAREAELLSVIKTLAEHTRFPSLPQHQPENTVPLRERILQYLQQAQHAKNVTQIAQALQLTTQPDRTLRQLIKEGFVTTTRPGLYAAVEPDQLGERAGRTQSGPLLEQVWRVVQEAGRPIKAYEVQAQLNSSRPVHQELSILVRDRKIYRISSGTYAVLETLGIE